jgi:hypothetical protein
VLAGCSTRVVGVRPSLWLCAGGSLRRKKLLAGSLLREFFARWFFWWPFTPPIPAPTHPTSPPPHVNSNGPTISLQPDAPLTMQGYNHCTRLHELEKNVL